MCKATSDASPDTVTAELNDASELEKLRLPEQLLVHFAAPPQKRMEDTDDLLGLLPFYGAWRRTSFESSTGHVVGALLMYVIARTTDLEQFTLYLCISSVLVVALGLFVPTFLYASALLHVSVCSAFASLEEVDVLGWLLYPVLWPLGWAANLIEVCDDDVEGDPAMRMRYEWQVNNRCARGRLDRRGSMLAAVHTDAGGAPLDVDAWGDF